ncbi:MAG TPA: hypothetical protein VNA25_08270 [Phycisphaerae bacterium]|nr:hypothetical protein [Phycisphaerae bacterium]
MKITVPWWVLVACAVGGFLAGAFVADSRNAKQRGRAEEAERVANDLRIAVRLDSAVIAEMRMTYLAERVASMAQTAALTATEGRLAAEAQARRAERVVLTARSDSLERLLADTATVVPRQTYEAARGALAAAIREVGAATALLAPLKAERDSWRGLWAQADSGWTASTAQVARLNEALAAQVRATDAWRRAAKPTLGMKVLRALPPAAIGGVLCYAFCPRP